jgi:uncharacterized membrane protein
LDRLRRLGQTGTDSNPMPKRDHFMQRDLMKTVSFAVMHFTVAFAIAYALTGSVAIATGIGLIEPFANSIAFYFHERAWRSFENRSEPAVLSQSHELLHCTH